VKADTKPHKHGAVKNIVEEYKSHSTEDEHV